ncbi:hypothetical protein PRIPAC_75822 [Pristionchus pacificus]|uniref:Uncharacterized protein n=1 Tax=Pristionchus pacificus TaxID=54126 RepID=A0A2A6CRN7_PRIPA|nr:hypothetical protein PRIPAC_75822 [Pristionchus pacificus]|eukprot:PDM80713.1 hypothetical protein PRIPAC_35716 [Pristionchus pacificus]
MGGFSLLSLSLLFLLSLHLHFSFASNTSKHRDRPCSIISSNREYSFSSPVYRSTPRWKKSACLALQGQIHNFHAECPCCPSPSIEFRNDRKISKVDLVAFIVLLIIVDMFIFSFTF